MGSGVALSPRPDPPFSLHQVAQNIVDAGQVAFAFGAQPFEHMRIETDAHRNPVLPEGENENSPGARGPRQPRAPSERSLLVGVER